MTIEVLADLLPRFVMEARRKDETPYPPATLMKEMCERAGISSRYTNHSGVTVIPTSPLFGTPVQDIRG